MDFSNVIILANGSFPSSELSVGYLRNASMLICCDGAVNNLAETGIEPDCIIGDLDSVPGNLKRKYTDRLVLDSDQETNDLTKAVRWCVEKGIKSIVILGATGKREDHTIGNISLLSDYAESLQVKMVTDFGIFIPVNSGEQISSWPGQQVSIFSFDPGTDITSRGLRYHLDKLILKNIWMGTLNECTGDSFSLSFSKGRVVVFLEY